MERLVEFSIDNNLVIGNTLFQHKGMQKYNVRNKDSKVINKVIYKNAAKFKKILQNSRPEYSS